MAFFTFFPGEDQSVILGVRGCVTFGFESGSLPKVALRLRCRGFLQFFRGFCFANTKRTSSNSPPLLVVFFSFLRLLLGFGVNATLHVCFWAVGPKLSFFFLSFNKVTVVSPEKGLVLLIAQCLCFFLLGFFHFSFSLSLSFYISFLFIFFLPCCLVS